MIAFENGPGDLIARAREKAGAKWIGRLMDCPYCLSVWFAAPVAVALHHDGIPMLLINWMALSGASVILEKTVGRKDDGNG